MNTEQGGSVSRRDFVRLTALAAGALGAASTPAMRAADQVRAKTDAADARDPLGPYTGAQLDHVAFPLGGIGAGMICLEGTGGISHVSLRNRPEIFNEPLIFAALAFPGGKGARVLEGPVPTRKLFGGRGGGLGAAGTTFGLPRFHQASFRARFPFATVTLRDETSPLEVEITGWSPFTPGDADSSSLPFAALEYRFANTTRAPVDAVFSYNAMNFMAVDEESGQVRPAPGGFIFSGASDAKRPWDEGYFSATVSEANVSVNCAWFRGGWFDPQTMAWDDVASGACIDRPPFTEGSPSPGASLFVPLHLEAGATRTIVLRFCWHVGKTNLREGLDPAMEGATKPVKLPGPSHVPWYAGRFATIEELTTTWAGRYDELRRRSLAFTDCFYDTTLPAEVIEAVAANLVILKSPTLLRQADGKMWAWEGCDDEQGSCPGTCTHVWNYAQAIAHLFPQLERGLRETEFGEAQDDRGHQAFRVPLPIRPTAHHFHAAADGQLGGILKVHRDWRISGDTAWLRSLWPKVRQSLDYCIATWDPERKGWLEEPQHNTYDIEFWGPNGMCSSIYLGALLAAETMGLALQEDVSEYAALRRAGVKRVEAELFNGEYFVQRIEWKGLKAGDPAKLKRIGRGYSPEACARLEREGPKYQYGSGCLADGAIGAWFALVCGVGQVLDPRKVTSHLAAVHRHNLRKDLSAHANPERPGFAAGGEGGLLLCTWPNGERPWMPIHTSFEVWTGIEYQVASHLLLMGRVDEGLDIVRTCRARYDGRVRNPFDEYECGHWYARALSSYALLQGLSGARYDAVDQVLHLTPSLRGDFRCFLATATGYGTVGVRAGKPFLEVRSGRIEVARILYTPTPA